MTSRDPGFTAYITGLLVGVAMTTLLSCAIIDGSAWRATPQPKLRPCNPTWTLDSVGVCADTSRVRPRAEHYEATGQVECRRAELNACARGRAL